MVPQQMSIRIVNSQDKGTAVPEKASILISIPGHQPGVAQSDCESLHHRYRIEKRKGLAWPLEARRISRSADYFDRILINLNHAVSYLRRPFLLELAILSPNMEPVEFKHPYSCWDSTTRKPE